MNTVERVARALAEATEYTAPEDWEIWEDEAKAALEALCEGLEWRTSLKDGEPDLLFMNGKWVGRIYRTKDHPGTPPEGYWHGELFYATNQTYRGPEAARASVEASLRNWIMGVETVTEKG